MTEPHEQVFDILVVGSGIAGLTAGLFAARCGRSTLVLMPLAPGGTLLNVERIEDFPGFPAGVAGYELGPVVQEQAERAGAVMQMAELERLDRIDDLWVGAVGGDRFQARTVVLATGTRPRALMVPGEERLAGRGVSHCASCDAPLFGGRTVAVVGGGDSALQEALTAAEHASDVVIVHRGEALRAQETYRARVTEHATIEVRLRSTVEEILGDEAVEGIRLRDAATGLVEDVPLSGVFVYIGNEPEVQLMPAEVERDDDGRIMTDALLATSLPGLFAAGDVRSGASGQAVSAAGDGAAAAMAAHRYLAATAVAGAHASR